jgi:hypothetical protein
VKKIGENAFGETQWIEKQCDGPIYINNVLYKIKNGKISPHFKIPYGVISISGEAFSECSSLEIVDIPRSVVYIGDGAFADCRSLREIDIPNSVKEIGAYAFEGNTALTSVDVSDSVSKICEGAFYNCSSLSHIHIPHDIESIERSTFENCTTLKHLSIPDSVIHIKQEAFRNSGLQDIFIPPKVMDISSWAFSKTSVREFRVDRRNIHYFSQDGVLYGGNRFKDEVYFLLKYPSNSPLRKECILLIFSFFISSS